MGDGRGLVVRKRQGTVAEFQGFRKDHDHRLERLPVVEFVFHYRCVCGGMLSVFWSDWLAWQDETTALNQAYRRLGQMEATPAPEITAAQRSVANKEGLGCRPGPRPG